MKGQVTTFKDSMYWTFGKAEIEQAKQIIGALGARELTCVRFLSPHGLYGKVKYTYADMVQYSEPEALNKLLETIDNIFSVDEEVCWLQLIRY